MDNQDHRRIHTPGHESHGVYVCHKCGWPFPNPHPSAKHRRAHKKICGTIEGYQLFDSEGQPHSNASDDSDDDHKMPSPKPAMEMSKNLKGVGGIGEKLIRSEDEVFSDAVADFSDGGLSSDSAISVEKMDRKVPKLSELSENKCFDAASVSQLIVKSGEGFQVQSPGALKSEEVEVAKTPELLGQPSGFVVEPSSFSDSDLTTKASTVVDSDDSFGIPSNSHLSKAEAMSDVIPEMGIHVTGSNLTSVAETNLKGLDGIESDRDMVEIAKSFSNAVDETSEKSSKIEVGDEETSSGEMAEGAAALDQKYNANLSSVVSQDNVLPSDADSVSVTNAFAIVVQMESKHMPQFAASSNPVNDFQEKGEGDVNVFTLSNPDLAHSQSEFENCVGQEGGVAVQNPLSLHLSEPLKHEEDDLKITLSVTEEPHSDYNSNQLTEEKEVLFPDMHALDNSIKQGCINSDPLVEVTAVEHAEVSPVKHIFYGDQRSIEVGASEDSMKSEISKTCTVGSSEELGSDDVGKNLQHRNLLEGSVMVSSDDLEDFKDCEEEVSRKSFNNLHSTEAFKVKEGDLKDTINEENRSDFKLSQLSKEREIISPDVRVSDDIIKQELVHDESQVEDALAEEQAVVYPVTLTAESIQRSDEIRGSVNTVNTEKNESHAVGFSVAHKLDDACKTLQEKSLLEDGILASSKENLRNVSIDFLPSQTSILSRDGTSHHEKKRNDLDDVVVDSKCKGGDEESDIGFEVGTFQPSDLLQLEGETSSDLFKSSDASETGKTEKCDKYDTQVMGASPVKDTLSPNSGSIPFESQIVSEDVRDGQARKPTGIDSTVVNAVPGIKEDRQVDEIINNSKVKEECNTVSNTYSNLPQAQDTEPSKAVEKHAKELPPHSHLDTDQSAQSVPAVEDNTAVEPSGDDSGTSIVTASDRNGNNLVKFGSSVIDASVDSGSRCDSLEGNWGSVSVLSVQSDAPAITDGEALPSAETGKSNLNSSKAAAQGLQSEKSDIFEPPSFMTLVEHEHMVGPKAAASEGQKGQNPQQPNPMSSQAGWFPTLTHVVNESQGRKKNEEIIAKVTNWSTSKQSSTPLKSLLGEAANSNKPKSPKLDGNLASSKNGEVATDNDSGLTTVNSILGPESPAAQAARDKAGKEWNSPARYPADIKREKRKIKSRPYWVQFVCCSSVDPR
ncbi:uncharacterized protein LOC129308784 [Prosopis cineraria]|uniref:uncharacterized protein LOC129308784 n=1 Tax=Prosopis cineraria TaxID=364024 RepID=UPI00240F22EE|nr:uncharacterized protein LOC129308784 [Prosopis cineraria]